MINLGIYSQIVSVYNSTQEMLQLVVRPLFRPLVSLLLRNRISFETFADLAKKVYVDVASQELKDPEGQPSNSQIAGITGLTEHEVFRLNKGERAL